MKNKIENIEPASPKKEAKRTSEGRSKSPESSLEKETIDSIFEIMLERSRFVDKGNNGVIKFIKTQDMPEIIKNEITQQGKEIQTGFALKLLKIYEPGKGKKEFKMQMKALRIIRESGKTDLARVPEALMFRTITVTNGNLFRELKNYEIKLPRFNIPEDLAVKCGLKDGESFDESELTEMARKKLEESGFEFPEVKVEIILMDFVEGKSLAKIMFEEIFVRTELKKELEKIAKNKITQELEEEIEKGIRNDLKRMEFDALHEEVGRALGFAKPGGKHADQGMKIFEERKVMSQNLMLVFDFIKKSDFKLQPEWLDKIERTLKLWHDNNFHHCDLHERNVMIGPNGEDVYIIDFGEAKVVEPGAEIDDVYENKGKGSKLVYDKSMVPTYRPLTIKETKIETAHREFIEDLEKERKEIARGKEWPEFLKSLSEEKKMNNSIKMMNKIAYSRDSFMEHRYWKAIAVCLMEIAKTDSAGALEYINGNIKDIRKPALQNILSKTFQIIKNRPLSNK